MFAQVKAALTGAKLWIFLSLISALSTVGYLYYQEIQKSARARADAVQYKQAATEQRQENEKLRKEQARNQAIIARRDKVLARLRESQAELTQELRDAPDATPAYTNCIDNVSVPDSVYQRLRESANGRSEN